MGTTTHKAASIEDSTRIDPFNLEEFNVSEVVREIHAELKKESAKSELTEMSKYYFDGGGKMVRPIISMCTAHAYNCHTNINDPLVYQKQRQVALISEMIHTASLVHDDILDRAETRRGKQSINTKWSLQKSTIAGDFILGVSSKMLAKIDNPDVIQILSQVLADLVEGEFQQLSTIEDESERFEQYLSKSFNKTASLMAYSCKANACLSGASQQEVDNCFQYGRNVGISFQLVDDLLDFVASADQLGKPAAGSDLKLGLATAPVLFAARQYPHLNDLIQRRFVQQGDVEQAFKLVVDSDGLVKTKNLAQKHIAEALKALETLTDSKYKQGLVTICDKVLNRLK